MSEGMAVKLSAEEGNMLLLAAGGFACPSKLETVAISVAEQLQANLQVGKLYRELKRHSPYLKSSKRIVAFGPLEAWEVTEVPGEDGGTAGENYKLVAPEMEVEVSLKRDALNGLTWLLVCMLHPASPMVRKAGAQEEICWPVARKIGRERAIQKEIKLDPNAESKWDSMKSDAQYDAAPARSDDSGKPA